MQHRFSFAAITLMTLFYMAACNTTHDCPDGLEYGKGDCNCPEGKFRFNFSCLDLDADTYIGLNPACYCYDTMLVSISGSGTYRSMGMFVKYGRSVGSLSQNITYFEQSNGDSLYTPQFDLRCFDARNTPLKPAMYGKKQKDGSWNLRLEFRNPLDNAVVDNCNIQLTPNK